MANIFGILLFFLCVPSVFAMDTREIMVKNFYSGKVSEWQTLTKMTLIDKKGFERVRTGKSINKLQKDGIDYMRLYRFFSPEDIHGTGLLTVEHSNRDDDMWIYLPALKKARRIVASNKRDSFVGSDFSYVDIVSSRVDDFVHYLKGQENIDGIDCFVIESIVKDEKAKRDTGYSKKISWIRKDNFVEIKIDYYDEGGEFFKTQVISDIYLADTVKGRWIAMKREIKNQKTGHKTIITFEKMEIDKGIRDDIFTVRTLERME